MTERHYVYRVRLVKMAEAVHLAARNLTDCAARVERWLREPGNAGRRVESVELVGELIEVSITEDGANG